MKSSRLAGLLAVIVIFALLAGTWFIGIAPRFAEVAKAEAERVDVEQGNAIQQATLQRLMELDANLPELQAELAELRLAIPSDAKSKSVIKWLQSIAVSTGVTYDNISMEVAELYVAPEDVAEDPVAEPNPQLEAAKAVVGAGGFYILPIQFEFLGTYAQVSSAISLVQAGQRYMLVYGVDIEEGLPADDTPITALVKGQLFVLLDSSGAPVVEEPAA